MPLSAAALVFSVGQAAGQGAAPVPLPEVTQAIDPASPQSGFSGAGAVPFVGGGGLGAGGLQGRPAEDCMSEFIPLREEAERRGRLIKAASERNAPPVVGCWLIGEFVCVFVWLF